MRSEELTDVERSGLQRLVEDEDLMGALVAVCNITAEEYKDRAYRFSTAVDPDMSVITNNAHIARALLSVEDLIRARYKDEFEVALENVNE